ESAWRVRRIRDGCGRRQANADQSVREAGADEELPALDQAASRRSLSDDALTHRVSASAQYHHRRYQSDEHLDQEREGSLLRRYGQLSDRELPLSRRHGQLHGARDPGEELWYIPAHLRA